MSKKTNIMFFGLIGIVSIGYFYETSSEKQTVEANIIDKFYQSKGGYKLEMQLTDGDYKGQVVVDKVDIFLYKDVNVNDTVKVDIIEGRLTSLLHADNSYVVKRKNKM